MSRNRGVENWNPMIGIWDPDDWNPGLRGFESGIQRAGIQNPVPL